MFTKIFKVIQIIGRFKLLFKKQLFLCNFSVPFEFSIVIICHLCEKQQQKSKK